MGFGSTTSQQSSQQNQLSPAQSAYQTNSANWLSNQVGQLGPSYTGQTTAPLTSTQQSLIGQMGTTGAEGTGAEQSGLGALGAYAGGQYLNDPFTANYLQSTANYANSNFQAQQPSLESNFIAAGQTGPSSPMAQYLNQSNANFQLGLQNQLAQQGLGQYNTEQQNQLNAANAAASQGANIASQGLSAAGQEQTTQQNALNSALALWQQQQAYPWQAALGIPSLVSTPQGTTSSGTSTTSESPLSALMSMFNMNMTV